MNLITKFHYQCRINGFANVRVKSLVLFWLFMQLQSFTNSCSLLDKNCLSIDPVLLCLNLLVFWEKIVIQNGWHKKVVACSDFSQPLSSVSVQQQNIKAWIVHTVDYEQEDRHRPVFLLFQNLPVFCQLVALKSKFWHLFITSWCNQAFASSWDICFFYWMRYWLRVCNRKNR